MRREETFKKARVVPASTTQTVGGSQTYREHNQAYKSFTTKPKLRRLTFHKLQTVRSRVYALQESFFPTSDVSYAAVVQRMATLLGLVDDQTVLAYLGRPECTSQSVMDQTVRYLKSGATVPKRHYFKRKLPAKRGYIERFGLGYVYVKNGEWWIHWKHTAQLTLPDLHECVNPPTLRKESEGLEQHEISKDDFSLSYNTSKGDEDICSHSTLKDHSELCSEKEREERESLKRERNCESESIRNFHGKDHNMRVKVNGLTPLAKAILRIAGKPPPAEQGSHGGVHSKEAGVSHG